ncbi:SIMPL domain-containing protein [Actinoplanes sp. NPDC051513]|uniref:SIMPL domain-containing protein n=1 Tax=Actinoplanes sp. NPDC051513 TaxID=3363908 RepID=UPI00379B290A
MNRSRITTPVLVVPALLVALSSWLLGARPASASTSSPPGDQVLESVLVTGIGEVFGEPDVLTADFAVEADASTVGEALDRATTAATRTRDALVRAGMARADLQTSNVGISSRLNDEQEVIGYTVSQGLTATIRNLPRAGALISAATAAGGDAARLNGVSFAIEDDTALLTEARKKAFDDARGKAELYAREAGRPLGRVVKVSEAAPSYEVPMGQNSMAAADSSFPIEPGRQQLTVTVTVEWALDPPPAG